MQQVKTKNNVLYKISNVITKIAEKYMPDAYIFAFILTAIVFIAGIVVTKHSPVKMIDYYFSGTWSLLEFGMQVCLMIILATVSISTPTLSKLLSKFASIPKTPTQAIVFGSFLMLILFPLNSTFALIFGAVYAREIGKNVEGVHYPLLVAVCYCGYMTWQGGFGGTTPLLMATEGSWAANILGHAVPLTETIFSPLNITLLLTFLITVPLLAKFMIPKRKEEIVTVDPKVFLEDEIETATCPENATPAEKLEYSRKITFASGLFVSVYVLHRFYLKGIEALDLNMINAILLALSLLFVANTTDLMTKIKSATKGTAGVIIQFPIYAGVMGMITHSGLGSIFYEFFMQIATKYTLTNIIHLSSAILNIFIPSGGGKWAIEAPIYLPLAESLGVPVQSVITAASYGESITDLIQPFWALPLLSITKLSMKNIMGYCFIISVYGFIATQIILFLFSVFVY